MCLHAVESLPPGTGGLPLQSVLSRATLRGPPGGGAATFDCCDVQVGQLDPLVALSHGDENFGLEQRDCVWTIDHISLAAAAANDEWFKR